MTDIELAEEDIETATEILEGIDEEIDEDAFEGEELVEEND